jgi:hypothetical protein
VEGWATGHTIINAARIAKDAVIITFGEKNLVAIAEWVREQYPNHKIIIAADDDWRLEDNPGKTEGKKAARAVGGYFVMPEFGGDRGTKDTDFNDLFVSKGMNWVEQSLQSARLLDGAEATDEEEEADPDENEEATTSRKPNQAALIVASAAEASLFHNEDDKGYADIVVDGHRETWPIRSQQFRRWLVHLHYLAHGSAPARESLNSAMDTLEARAHFEGERRPVFVRVGGHGEKVYLDLCNDRWQAVEIDTVGWRVIDNPPVRFRRAQGMQALPKPVETETKPGIQALRRFVNLPRQNLEKKSIYDPEFILFVMFIVAALRDRGPYPGLAVLGEEGTAKSTLEAIIRALTDPASVKERQLPREVRDLFIATRNGYLVSFGNISRIPEWLSNSLCTLATGGGFATRELRSDDREVLFHACRPFVMNGIKFSLEPDLANRVIFIHPPVIAEDERYSEEEFWSEFKIEQPMILGALLNLLSHGLRMLPETEVENLPRMADFHHFAQACEGELWSQGRFARAYRTNQRKATATVIDEDVVANALRTLVTNDDPEWQGNVATLLDNLTQLVGERQARSKDWPTEPRGLTARITKLQASLRKIGLTVEFGGRNNRGRTVTISRQTVVSDRHDSHNRHSSNDFIGLLHDGRRDDRVMVASRLRKG